MIRIKIGDQSIEFDNLEEFIKYMRTKEEQLESAKAKLASIEERLAAQKAKFDSLQDKYKEKFDE